MQKNIINAVDNIIYNDYKKSILILSGGGIKGIAHIGALKCLEDNDLLNHISVIAGTSIGAIIGYLLIIGYKPIEMFEIICELNCDVIFDGNILNLINFYSYTSNNKLKYILERLTKEKKINKNISFFELNKIFKKKLIVTATCINDGNVSYFDYMNCPDMSVIKAVVMSSCIPVIFAPIKHDNKYYIDGACIDNYPIHLFKQNLKNCIGIHPVEKYYINEPMDNIENYFFSVVKSLKNGHGIRSFNDYEEYTIMIDTDNITAISLDMSINDKNNLYEKGYNETYKWLIKNNIILIHC